MSHNGRNGSPAYKRIQSGIRKRIEGGHLQPGDVVPSERELAKLHSVSLMTARHALAELEKDGMVERRRGAGTFVAPPKIHWNRLTSFTQNMASRGLPARSKILQWSTTNSEEISARLGLSVSSPLLKLERLRKAGDEAFAIETCYLPAEDFPGLSKAALESGSLFTILENMYDVKLAYADEEIDATEADPRSAQLLAIPRGGPLLRIRQVIYSKKGKPSLYVLGLYRSDRHTLTIRRFR